MKLPLSQRKGIPFFYHKTDMEFQKDVYERYDSMVLRQSALHLADELWGKYPMQTILDFAHAHYPDKPVDRILEVGSGVGRWIATLAQSYPDATCWGMDYSYQMLKQANEFWIQGQDVFVNLTNRGFPHTLNVKGHQLNNLYFGLAKAERLPLSDDSQDLVLSSFLLDRLDEPTKGLAEMYRVLKPGGKLILVTPLNFSQATHWSNLYPPIKIHRLLIQIGFSIVDWNDELIVEEPLDTRGNVVTWKCLGFVVSK